MAANMVLNVIFVVPLYFYFNIGHVGLALATAASAYINAGLLFLGLWRTKVFRPQPGWSKFGFQLLVANIFMAVCLIYLLTQYDQWQIWNWLQRGMHLAIVCVSGLLVYVVTLPLLGCRMKDFRMKH